MRQAKLLNKNDKNNNGIKETDRQMRINNVRMKQDRQEQGIEAHKFKWSKQWTNQPELILLAAVLVMEMNEV